MGDSSDAADQKSNCEDTGDALGFNFGSSSKKKEVINTFVEKDAYYYNMDHKFRGMAVIFNHKKFLMPHLKERNGTEVDCENLQKILNKLEFEVTVYNDLGVKHIHQNIERIASMDHSDKDCLAIFILTHGERGVLFANDGAYKHDNIYESFRPDNCPSLAGKPKLFFIQACQGSRLDAGIVLSTTQTDSAVSSYKIPLYADFLVVYSTIPGFYSWRNTSNGSWFVQALTAELRENCFKYDLLTLLTFVCRRVAVDFESNVPGDIVMHSQKQIPCLTSMLTRIVKFSPKPSVLQSNGI